jgi:hypothetical protein
MIGDREPTGPFLESRVAVLEASHAVLAKRFEEDHDEFREWQLTVAGIIPKLDAIVAALGEVKASITDQRGKSTTVAVEAAERKGSLKTAAVIILLIAGPIVTAAITRGWDWLDRSPPVPAGPRYVFPDASAIVHECAPGAPWPCDSSPSH